MALYKKAGARYFVSMGTQHDHFFLWNSKLHRWNALSMGPHRGVGGDWQKAARKYGLNGSRPWAIYGEGAAKAKGGSFSEADGYSAKDIRFTTKGATLYAFALGWPSDNQRTIRALARPGGSDINAIKSTRLLGSCGKVEWTQTADGLVLKLPADTRNAFRSRIAKMTFSFPKPLVDACCRTPERRLWLEQLPQAVDKLQTRWSLTLENAFDDSEGSCAWVAPAIRRDGTRAVFKMGMPHMEAVHEIQGLRFWDGNPVVRVLEADETLNAVLLERCEPGTPLRRLPEPEQDVVLAGLLRRLWRRPTEPHPFRPLSLMTAQWAAETRAQNSRWPDPALVEEGLQLFDELSRPSETDALLATDLHAGNVLRAQRESWLVIDPKPFVGDAAYDATQHLFNCAQRMRADPHAVIRRFADLLEVDAERVRLWMFARAAAEPRDLWDDDSLTLARLL